MRIAKPVCLHNVILFDISSLDRSFVGLRWFLLTNECRIFAFHRNIFIQPVQNDNITLHYDISDANTVEMQSRCVLTFGRRSITVEIGMRLKLVKNEDLPLTRTGDAKSSAC